MNVFQFQPMHFITNIRKSIANKISNIWMTKQLPKKGKLNIKVKKKTTNQNKR